MLQTQCTLCNITAKAMILGNMSFCTKKRTLSSYSIFSKTQVVNFIYLKSICIMLWHRQHSNLKPQFNSEQIYTDCLKLTKEVMLLSLKFKLQLEKIFKLVMLMVHVIRCSKSLTQHTIINACLNYTKKHQLFKSVRRKTIKIVCYFVLLLVMISRKSKMLFYC